MDEKWCHLCDHPAEWIDEEDCWMHQDSDLDTVCGKVAMVDLPQHHDGDAS